MLTTCPRSKLVVPTDNANRLRHECPPVETRSIAQRVGWVVRSETHHLHCGQAMGFAKAQPILHTKPRLHTAFVSRRYTCFEMAAGMSDVLYLRHD